MDRNSDYKITKEDILSCWSEYYLDYFADMLNGEMEDARGDLLSLIESKYDLRKRK